MTTQVITVKPTDSIRHAVIKMAVDNVAGAPVVDNRSHVLGMISQTDILRLILKYQQKLDNGTGGETLLNQPLDRVEGQGDVVEAISQEIASMTVEQMMVRTVITTTPDAKLIEVLKAMMQSDIGRIPVLEQGVLVGTISRSDIIFALYKKKV